MSTFGKRNKTHVSFKSSLDPKGHSRLPVSSAHSRSNSRLGPEVSRGGGYEDATLLELEQE